MASGGGGGGGGAPAAAAAAAAPAPGSRGFLSYIFGIGRIYAGMALERWRGPSGEVPLTMAQIFGEMERNIVYTPPPWLTILANPAIAGIHSISPDVFGRLRSLGEREMKAGFALLRALQLYLAVYPITADNKLSPMNSAHADALDLLLKHILLYLVYEYYKFSGRKAYHKYYMYLFTNGYLTGISAAAAADAAGGASQFEIVEEAGVIFPERRRPFPHIRYLSTVCDRLNTIIAAAAALAAGAAAGAGAGAAGAAAGAAAAVPNPEAFLLQSGGGAGESAKFPRLTGTAGDIDVDEHTSEEMLTRMQPVIAQANRILNGFSQLRDTYASMAPPNAHADFTGALSFLTTHKRPGPAEDAAAAAGDCDRWKAITDFVSSLIGAGAAAGAAAGAIEGAGDGMNAYRAAALADAVAREPGGEDRVLAEVAAAAGAAGAPPPAVAVVEQEIDSVDAGVVAAAADAAAAAGGGAAAAGGGGGGFGSGTPSGSGDSSVAASEPPSRGNMRAASAGAALLAAKNTVGKAAGRFPAGAGGGVGFGSSSSSSASSGAGAALLGAAARRAQAARNAHNAWEAMLAGAGGGGSGAAAAAALMPQRPPRLGPSGSSSGSVSSTGRRPKLTPEELAAALSGPTISGGKGKYGTAGVRRGAVAGEGEYAENSKGNIGLPSAAASGSGGSSSSGNGGAQPAAKRPARGAGSSSGDGGGGGGGGAGPNPNLGGGARRTRRRHRNRVTHKKHASKHHNKKHTRVAHRRKTHGRRRHH